MKLDQQAYRDRLVLPAPLELPERLELLDPQVPRVLRVVLELLGYPVMKARTGPQGLPDYRERRVKICLYIDPICQLFH